MFEKRQILKTQTKTDVVRYVVSLRYACPFSVSLCRFFAVPSNASLDWARSFFVSILKPKDMKAIQNFMYELAFLPVRTLNKIILILCVMVTAIAILLCLTGYLYSVNRLQQGYIDLVDEYTEQSIINVAPR